MCRLIPLSVMDRVALDKHESQINAYRYCSNGGYKGLLVANDRYAKSYGGNVNQLLKNTTYSISVSPLRDKFRGETKPTWFTRFVNRVAKSPQFFNWGKH